MTEKFIKAFKSLLKTLGSRAQSLGRLRIPSKKLPSAQIRAFCEHDYEACCEIYRLNEPGRFPVGYYQHFADVLLTRRALFLVVVVANRIIGFGGVSKLSHSFDYQADLHFGMIHPEYHKMGYGTALLLARLSVLPEPFEGVVVTLSPVPSSKSFYVRFGFQFYKIFRDGFDHQIHEIFCVVFKKQDWRACKAALADAGIDSNIDSSDIPEIEVQVAAGI